MAGILETLNERRAYIDNMRKNDPAHYVRQMSSATEKLAKKLGQKDTPGARLQDLLSRQNSDNAQRSHNQAAQNRKDQSANRAQGERSIAQIKTVGYDLGNDIRSLRTNLTSVMEKLLKSSRNIERTLQSQGGGSILDLFDGDGRGRRRRPGARRRAGRMRAGRALRGVKGLGQRAARGLGFGRGAKPPPIPRGVRPPPLPGQATGFLGRAAQTGGRALGSLKGLGSRALSAGGRAAGSVGRAATGLGSKAAGALGGGGGAALARRAGAAGAIAAGGYTAYQTLKDDTKTDAEKAKAVAGTAGGTAGALALGAAGAQGGAAIGTMIFPGVGTAIGGAVGGIGGGALGYFGGEKIVSNTIDSVNDKISESGVGDHIGRAVAMVMTPFSEEARDAVKSDFKNNILPGWKQTLTPLQNTFSSWGEKFQGFMGNFGEVIGGFGDMLTAQFNKLPQFAQDAIKGAGSALLAPVKSAVQGAQWAGGKALDALSSTGSTGARIAQGVRDVGNKAVSALPAGLAGSLGFIAAKYESGGRGVATVSTGKGDHGGVSYGKHQLATNNGSMAKFLASKEGSKYASQFAGLKPGSKEFNERYKQVVGADAAGMEKAQHDYIVDTHYNKLASKVGKDTGLDVNKRGRAVQEAIMSTSVQYGGATSVVSEALKGKDPSKMSDADIVNAVQDYKARTVGTKFKSSSQATRDSIAKRIENERRDLLGVAADDAKNKGAANAETAVASTAAGAKDATATPASPTAAKPAATAVVQSAQPASPATPVPSSNTARVASAQPASPIVPVRPGTPEEVKPVAVVAAPPTPAPEADKGSGSAQVAQVARPSANGISFEDIPAFVPDPSMVNILFGRA